MRIGYHYTAKRNLTSILRNGLLPSSISRLPNEIKRTSVKQVWLYKRRKRGVKLLGVLFETAIRNKCHSVVCLRVKYRHNETFRSTHKLQAGIFGHKCRMDFSQKTIPPKDIEVIEIYDLSKIEKLNEVTNGTQTRENRTY